MCSIISKLPHCSLDILEKFLGAETSCNHSHFAFAHYIYNYIYTIYVCVCIIQSMDMCSIIVYIYLFVQVWYIHVLCVCTRFQTTATGKQTEGAFGCMVCHQAMRPLCPFGFSWQIVKALVIWHIHPASRGVAAHTAGLFRSVRGAKGGFPPWGSPS